MRCPGHEVGVVDTVGHAGQWDGCNLPPVGEGRGVGRTAGPAAGAGPAHPPCRPGSEGSRGVCVTTVEGVGVDNGESCPHGQIPVVSKPSMGKGLPLLQAQKHRVPLAGCGRLPRQLQAFPPGRARDSNLPGNTAAWDVADKTGQERPRAEPESEPEGRCLLRARTWRHKNRDGAFQKLA